MNYLENLTENFRETDGVRFRKLSDGIVAVEIANPHAVATVSLYGGHAINWHPKHQVEPVLWMSDSAQFRFGKAIRGGVPICWPWFGAHQSNTNLPSHGFARVASWQLSNIRALTNDETEIELSMFDPGVDGSFGALQIRLSIRITIGTKLSLALTTHNDGSNPFIFTEGLHTYFKVGDIGKVSVSGLNGSDYVDLLKDRSRYEQNGSIRFNAELGRIYTNNKNSCVIHDPVLRRLIRVDKSGSSSTAVWNPWLETASKMDDLGAVGWREMVCVETANALENAITLATGQSHTMSACYSVEQVK